MFKIHFDSDFDERAELEMAARGYLSHTVVELADGHRYPVFFFDPVRLRQELEIDARNGRPFIAEPGMVVIPEVTRGAIQAAVERLVAECYFQHLKPLDGSPGPAMNGATDHRPALAGADPD